MPTRPVDYVHQPFVRSQFVPSTATLGDALRRRGDIEAQLALSRGQGSINVWGGLAQAFADYQQAVRQQKVAEQALALKEQERKDALTLKQQELNEKKAEREQTQKRLDTAEQRAIRSDASLRARDTQPGILSSEMADDLRPSGRVQVLDGAPVLMRTPDQIRQAGLDAEAKRRAESAQQNQENTALRLEAQLQEQMRHNKATEAKQPRPLAREVVPGPDGPLLVDKESGTTTRILDPDGQPVKTAMSSQERMDSRKFSKAAPVLRGIGELSEKINVNQGLYAKMAGGANKLKAKANLDDDVAEYEALVSGFTPMIARALGHTGVLTEQDVQSVKALFPRPGDSKSLRDRKINRMMTIIGELEGVEGVGNVAPAKPEKKNPNR